MEGLIISDLTFSYKERIIFKNFNLKLENNKIYALVGPSGSGKTTLSKIITGHITNFQGEVFINGKKIEKPCRDSFIVHQEDDLFPWMNVRQQLEFVINQLKIQADVNSLLKLFKLDLSRELYPYQLSGGMKKRLSLLRAELVAPKVLILDETLSSLDRELLDAILFEMVSIWKKRNSIIILVTHQLDSVQKYIDQVIQL